MTMLPDASAPPPWLPERFNCPLVVARALGGARVAVALFRGSRHPPLTVHDARGALLAPLEGHGTTYYDHGDEHVPIGGSRDVEVTALAFAPDGSRLASGDELGAVLVWDARPAPRAARLWWRLVAPRPRPPLARHEELGGRILALSWGDNARIAVDVAGDSGTPRRVEIDALRRRVIP